MINTVFFGTPEFAKVFLAQLHADNGIAINAIICQPDKPVGRRKILTEPATKVFAKKYGIPILQPKKLQTKEITQQLKNLNADLFVVIAYGKMIPQAILDIPKLGTINVHPSLLPKYRGPSPIQSAIINQEQKSGISIMLIDDKMDHGPVLTQEKILLQKDETSISLGKKVIDIGVPLLIKTIKKYAANEIKPQEQNHDKATFCKMLTKIDGKINWNKPAKEIDAQFRALIEWPGVFTSYTHEGKAMLIKIHELALSDDNLSPGAMRFLHDRLFIGTKTQALEILALQPEGKTKMQAKSFMQGYREMDGQILDL